MPGPNLTGNSDTTDLVLGRGIVYFAVLSAAGLPINWRDMGNCNDFKVSAKTEVLDHKSSRTGIKFIDAQVSVSQDMNLSFTLDEINDENMAAFLSGTQASPTNAAIAGFTIYTMIPVANVAAGRWYDIQTSTGVRAYDINSADLTLATSNGTPVSLAKDVDYIVDTIMGRVQLIATSAKIITLVAGGVDGITAVLVAKAGAGAVDEVRGLTRASVLGAIKFIQENPSNNSEKNEIQFHFVQIKAEGDLELIGDKYQELKFTCAAGKNPNALYAASPVVSVRTPKIETGV